MYEIRDKMNPRLIKLHIHLMCKQAMRDKKLRDNYRIDIVKEKRFEGEVKIIAQRLYFGKYERSPVFGNGIKSWINFYIKTDVLLLEAAYSEFGGSAFRDNPDKTDQDRRDAFEQHNWAMKRRRNVEKLYFERKQKREVKNGNTAPKT